MKHINLKKQKLKSIKNIDLKKLQNIAKLIRAQIFTTVENAKSGHPGGSSSKTEQLIALLASGVFNFDIGDPKNSGRDRLIWSAGHCTPLLYGTLNLIYKNLDLATFRKTDGLPGHAESQYPLSDLGTGSSGHGLAGAAGIATVHQSCGLDTKTYVMMGDAESEEGITYEARNLIKSLDLKNLFVSLDYNHYGIDGNINEVINSNYVDHWLGLGWNVIEVDGHNILQLIHAYRQAQKMGPCVILCHTIKGKYYGDLANTADSHGQAIATKKYRKIIEKLKTEKIPDENVEYFIDLIHQNNKILPESKNIKKIKTALKRRKLISPRDIKKPKKLPSKINFSSNQVISTRQASQSFFAWLMKETAFLYAGSGDLAKSTYTNEAENIYGLINKKNKYGRGIRFGIAEQNMAMFSSALTQDILPGEFKPMSVFGTFAVFTSLMSNSIRMSLISNHSNPNKNGFFVALASHDGPETGEDGPTHQGLYWMSLYNAYPGIKVYKPLDANELVTMMFYALKKQEPIILSISREKTPVFDRTKYPSAQLATQGAYIFKDYKKNNKPKQVLAICGGKVMDNALKALPELEKKKNIKIIAITSPELYQEQKPNILTEQEKKNLITLHNGWTDFLNPFILPTDYKKRTLGVDTYLKSGSADEVYKLTDLTSENIIKKVSRL